jgi:hypothetical protein
MPTYPLGFHLNPLTNPWVEKLTQTHTLIEQKPTGFRVAGTHCHLYCHSLSDGDVVEYTVGSSRGGPSRARHHYRGRRRGHIQLQPVCRCFGSDRTPGVAPQGIFRSRTVSTTVAKWFVPIARGTVDKVYRFGPLRDA